MSYIISDHLWIPKEDLEIKEAIGGGTYGRVCKGIWKGRGGNSVVAIKMVHTKDKETIADICQELNLMASLHFRHICQVHGGCIVSNNELWVVLEYVEGGNLHDYLELHGGTIGWDLKIEFCLQAAKALNYLHCAAVPIFHRDIKSFNLLIQKDHTILLTDFGLSKAKPAISSQTFTIGTVRWTAPEIFQDEPKWTEKADIHSLGMTMYEIVSEKFPYHEDTSIAIIRKKIKRGIRPDLPVNCPQQLANIIQQCWDLDPIKRPTSKQLVDLLLTCSETAMNQSSDVISATSSSQTTGASSEKENLMNDTDQNEPEVLAGPSTVRIWEDFF